MIATRLTRPGYACRKALILAQALPPSALSTLIDPLSKLIKLYDPSTSSAGTEPHYLLHGIATSLKEAGEAYKLAEAYAAQERTLKLWTEHFGKSEVAWTPPPNPTWPDWGMYGTTWVQADRWWSTE